MNVRIVASVAMIVAGFGGHAAADVATPAWQAPGFVMEEVVVTGQAMTPAWQEPGYVMDEIVVTAPASLAADVRAARAEQLERFLALHQRQRELLREQRQRELEEAMGSPTS